jgi:hypothetical protein
MRAVLVCNLMLPGCIPAVHSSFTGKPYTRQYMRAGRARPNSRPDGERAISCIPFTSHLHPIYIPFTSHLHPIYIPFTSHHSNERRNLLLAPQYLKVVGSKAARFIARTGGLQSRIPSPKRNEAAGSSAMHSPSSADWWAADMRLRAPERASPRCSAALRAAVAIALAWSKPSRLQLKVANRCLPVQVSLQVATQLQPIAPNQYTQAGRWAGGRARGTSSLGVSWVPANSNHCTHGASKV